MSRFPSGNRRGLLRRLVGADDPRADHWNRGRLGDRRATGDLAGEGAHGDDWDLGISTGYDG